MKKSAEITRTAPNYKKKKSNIVAAQTSYPCIGYYDLDNANVRKKIVYDVKIRGKPKVMENKEEMEK